jgi:pilus assembly protein CpaE
MNAVGAIRTILIDHDLVALDMLRHSLEVYENIQVLAETDSLIYGYEMIRQNAPELAFIDLSQSFEKGLETVQRISSYFKKTFIVISSDDLSKEQVLQCMRAGAREFLTRPFSRDDIKALMDSNQKLLQTSLQEEDSSGRILTLFSNKGGLGKTTLAVNLALALSEVVQKPVALVDLNLQLGDITTFLDVSPKETIIDIAKNISRVDATYLENSLAEYRQGKGHLYILADPMYAEEAEEITSTQINKVLTVLRSVFSYVVVDTTTSFDSKTLTALDIADSICLVSMVNLPNIRSTQRILTLFERLSYPAEKVKLLINRYVPDEEITIEDVEDTLEKKVYWQIPNNYNVVMTAINRGIPIQSVPNSDKLTKNFLDLAYKLTGRIEQMSSGIVVQPAPKASLFNRFNNLAPAQPSTSLGSKLFANSIFAKLKK